MALDFINSRDTIALGAKLRATRHHAGMTLKELAHRLRISHTQISRIERGQFKRLSRNVQKICKELKVDPHERDLASDSRMLASRLARAAAASPKWADLVASFVEAIEAAQSSSIHPRRQPSK